MIFGGTKEQLKEHWDENSQIEKNNGPKSS